MTALTIQTKQANRGRGHEASGEQRDLPLHHLERIQAEIDTLQTQLDGLRAKTALRDARDRRDADAETVANLQVHAVIPRLKVVLRPASFWPPAGSGYVGTRLIAALLRDGRRVRTTVRLLDREADVRTATRRDAVDDSGMELVAADLTADEGWAAAAAGCEEVFLVATPIPAAHPSDPDELCAQAREGTIRALRAARAVGARRVVLTSSFVAVGYTPKSSGEYMEATGPIPTSGLALPSAKVIAERAAWDFIEKEGGQPELVVVNPTFITGPTRQRACGLPCH
jgi:hypothetical protein